MGAGGNGNKTRLNLGSGMVMGINHWEREGMGLKKTFLLISSIKPVDDLHINNAGAVKITLHLFKS